MAAAITPNMMMCKPNAFVSNSVGWKHICKVSSSGIAIITRSWGYTQPGSFIIAYNTNGLIDINAIYANGGEAAIKKFRLSEDSSGRYIDFYYAMDKGNIIRCIVLDCAGIDASFGGVDADSCTLIGNEISV